MSTRHAGTRRALAVRIPLTLVLLTLTGSLATAAFNWSPRANLSPPRGFHAAGTIGDRIYVAGGGCLAGFCIQSTATAGFYDVTTDTWTNIPALPEARTYTGGAVASRAGTERFYVVGGIDVNGFPFNDSQNWIQEYTPSTMTWRRIPNNIPTNRVGGMGVATVNNVIYLIGGHDADFTDLIPTVYRYDPNDPAEAIVAYGDPMPQVLGQTGRSNGSVAASGNSIYYFGGYYGSNGYGVVTEEVHVFDTISGTWSSAAPLPGGQRVADSAAVTVGGKIYVVGGWDGSGNLAGIFDDVRVYDIAGDSWTAETPLDCTVSGVTQGRSGLSVHVADPGTGLALYAVGGNLGTSDQTTCHEYTAIVDCPPTPDADGDGLGDSCDPCPTDADNDSDADGVCNDGDGDGTPGNTPCSSGQVAGCDDNCPSDANPGQQDADGDGLGDACDPCPTDVDNDSDGDGICIDGDGDGTPGSGPCATGQSVGCDDNCPTTTNPGQDDGDGDGLGDDCDPCPTDPQNDQDGDGWCASMDNCPMDANPGQADADMDGLGDACDPCPTDTDNDSDGDGVCIDGDGDGTAGNNPCLDGFTVGCDDNCPMTSNPGQEEVDMDGLGDACDPCPTDIDNDSDGDGICNDGDGDGIPGNGPCANGQTVGCDDNCPGVSNPGQADMDMDGMGDACDGVNVPPDFNGITAACETSVGGVPEVTIQWDAATNPMTPPITYNVYRDTSLPVVPGAGTLVASNVTDLFYVDTRVACIDRYHYVVRAQDSGAPPVEDGNLVTATVAVSCADPLLPDPSPHLRVRKVAGDLPELDWTSFAAPVSVEAYAIHRTTDRFMIAGPVIHRETGSTWVDTSAVAGVAVYYFDVRSSNCVGDESVGPNGRP